MSDTSVGRVQIEEKKKTRDSEVARYNTATVPHFDSTNILSQFKV